MSWETGSTATCSSPAELLVRIASEHSALMKSLSLQIRFVATAALLGLGSLVQAQFTRTETFDTGPGFFTSEAGNHSGGNDFDFSNTNNTAGTSPAGEVGGLFARTSGFSYIADTALGGAFSRTDDFSLSGELVFTAANNPDGTIGIGLLQHRESRFRIRPAEHRRASGSVPRLSSFSDDPRQHRRATALGTFQYSSE